MKAMTNLYRIFIALDRASRRRRGHAREMTAVRTIPQGASGARVRKTDEDEFVRARAEMVQGEDEGEGQQPSVVRTGACDRRGSSDEGAGDGGTEDQALGAARRARETSLNEGDAR